MVKDSGGLAKVTCNFANVMTQRGHEVSIVFSDEKEGPFFFSINPQVQCYNLCRMQKKVIKFPLILKAKREFLRNFDIIAARTINDDFAQQYLLENIKRTIELCKPDIIIAFQPAASKLLLCDIDTNIPVITMSHGDPEDYFHKYPQGEIPALEKSAMCQVLLPSFAQHLKHHLPQVKTIVIGNAVPQFAQQANLGLDKEQYKIIFIGRLVKNHKRPHLLIEAFAKIAKEFPNWIVELWGAEDKKIYMQQLKKIIKDNNLTDRILLKGTTNDVERVLAQGDIYAFPSAYEGFGLTLAEGMSVGLPAIGYKSCTAVNELIVDNSNGYLCDDGIEPLAEKLRILMGDRDLRIKMGEQARKDMACYAPEQIWKQWEELMKSVSQLQ